MHTDSLLDPRYCNYLPVDVVGALHPLLTSRVGDRAVRVGTIMGGRCLLGAMLRCTSEQNRSPSMIEADALRDSLGDMVEGWTDEQWATRIPRIYRFVGRAAYVRDVLRVPEASLDVPAMYLYHMYEPLFSPRIYLLCLHYHLNDIPDPAPNDDVKVLPNPKRCPPLTASLRVVPMYPIAEFTPRCAIVVLQHEFEQRGHYECVGWREESPSFIVHTIFPLHHPLIVSLDAWADKDTEERLLEEQWRAGEPEEKIHSPDQWQESGHDMEVDDDSFPATGQVDRTQLEPTIIERPAADAERVLDVRPGGSPPQRKCPVPWRTKLRNERVVHVSTYVTRDNFPLLHQELTNNRTVKCVSCLVSKRFCWCPSLDTATRSQVVQAEQYLQERNSRHFRTSRA